MSLECPVIRLGPPSGFETRVDLVPSFPVLGPIRLVEEGLPVDGTGTRGLMTRDRQDGPDSDSRGGFRSCVEPKIPV